MRIAVLALLLIAASAPAAQPVVVELFTSQGCSSCPPAEELLGTLANEPGVIALAFHVDYWNRGGWVDPYSRPSWSQRQGAYAAVFNAEDIYTPQLVVDGRAGVLGSDSKAAHSLMAAARKQPHPVEVAITAGATATATLPVTVSIALPAGREGPSYLCTALTEDGLATAVKGGENAGSTMVAERVVRLMERIELKGSGPVAVSFALDPAWKRDHLRATAVVQDGRLKVLGAASVRLAP